MFVPALVTSLRTYNRKIFQADLCAGLTVGVVALPLAMAFSIACGLPPERGIYTAIAAGFLVSLFGGSKVQIGGPTGAFVVIIAGIVASFPDQALGLQALWIATLMAGGFLIIFGFCQMGALIRFIPFPVTTGFTSGIAVVIFFTQIRDLLGLRIEGIVPVDFFAKAVCYWNHLNTINLEALGVGVGTISAIVLLRQFSPKVPAMLVVMIGATLFSTLLGLHIETIGSRFGDLPNALPNPNVPTLSWGQMSQLVVPAFTIAILAAIESLLSATVADGMTGDRHKSNAELVAQGIGNIGAAIFGGIPATGAIARTATNIKSGAKTPVAGMIHALTLALLLLLFAPYAKMIPLAVLGGILAVVCYNMSELHTFKRLLSGPKSDAAVLMITFILTVSIDLVVAVEVGVVLAALLFIRRMSEISNVSEITHALTGDDVDAADPHSIHVREVPKGVEVFEVQGPFFFGAVDQFKDAVLSVFSRETRIVILRIRHVPALDATGLHALRDFYQQCEKRNIKLVLSGVRSQPHKVMKHDGFLDEIGVKNVCPDIDAALERTARLLEAIPEEREIR